MIFSYTAECPNCHAMNRLPLTTQDIEWYKIKYEIFECGECSKQICPTTGQNERQYETQEGN